MTTVGFLHGGSKAMGQQDISDSKTFLDAHCDTPPAYFASGHSEDASDARPDGCRFDLIHPRI
jgi:hypothetical protein